MFSTLKVGRCRYGLMMNELGFLIDDGVTVRLADDHFLMHTTSGGADRIAAWLEEWLQTEWTRYKVFVTPVTEQWAQFAIAGPKAREVLCEARARFRHLGTRRFPHMSMKEGNARRLSGARLSASASRASCPTKWRRPPISAAACGMRSSSTGAEFGIEVYGTEALHVLRAEKGFIVIGDETDGTVTPDDVGLDGLVSKKKADFIGKRSLEQSFLKECRTQAAGRAPHRGSQGGAAGRRLCGARCQGQAADGDDRTGHLDLLSRRPSIARSPWR